MFYQMKPDDTPRCRRLAGGLLHRSTHPRQVSARLAPPVMYYSPPASSSTPLWPSVYDPSIGLVVNIKYIRTCCGHLNVLCIFDPTGIAFKSGWNSTARMPRFVVSPSSLTNTPRCRRRADGQLPSLYPLSPSFTSFGTASVMCCSPPASSSTPFRPSVYYPSISVVVNIRYIRTFCCLLYTSPSPRD